VRACVRVCVCASVLTCFTVNELEDERAAGDDTRAPGQEVPVVKIYSHHYAMDSLTETFFLFTSLTGLFKIALTLLPSHVSLHLLHR